MIAQVLVSLTRDGALAGEAIMATDGVVGTTPGTAMAGMDMVGTPDGAMADGDGTTGAMAVGDGTTGAMAAGAMDGITGDGEDIMATATTVGAMDMGIITPLTEVEGVTITVTHLHPIL